MQRFYLVHVALSCLWKTNQVLGLHPLQPHAHTLDILISALHQGGAAASVGFTLVLATCCELLQPTRCTV